LLAAWLSKGMSGCPIRHRITTSLQNPIPVSQNLPPSPEVKMCRSTTGGTWQHHDTKFGGKPTQLCVHIQALTRSVWLSQGIAASARQEFNRRDNTRHKRAGSNSNHKGVAAITGLPVVLSWQHTPACGSCAQHTHRWVAGKAHTVLGKHRPTPGTPTPAQRQRSKLGGCPSEVAARPAQPGSKGCWLLFQPADAVQQQRSTLPHKGCGKPRSDMAEGEYQLDAVFAALPMVLRCLYWLAAQADSQQQSLHHGIASSVALLQYATRSCMQTQHSRKVCRPAHPAIAQIVQTAKHPCFEMRWLVMSREKRRHDSSRTAECM
jgi:hypothetical protein